ncbi:MAG: hypothetical protein OEY33_09505, partial [Bdellovibrionales bacterium]|nr:hypothetical protein [Bdellovibrionales bacterium]
TLENEVVGEHSGAAFYTLGQRKGLGLGGPGSPWYVVKKDMDKNIVYVERGENHPALFYHYLFTDELSLVNKNEEIPPHCQAKIRYRQKDQECFVEKEGNRLKVSFSAPQRAATPGQSIVFYNKGVCLGGAIIKEVGPSLIESNNSLGVENQSLF